MSSDDPRERLAPRVSTRREPGRHLAVVGPTASGKSAVALALAVRRNVAGLPTEIVSCDSMQVYRGMDIGTAKPTAFEQAMVPHHLIDIVDPIEDYNLPRFVSSAAAVLDDIERRGASAVLVGGTGLYVRGVVDSLDPPPRFAEIVAELEAEPDTAVLSGRLAELDPVALARIPTGNRRRVVRALEVTLGTGLPFSEAGPGLDHYGPTPFVLTGLWPTREVLTSRINTRYDAQVAAGLLSEVRSLAALGPALSRTAAQALGYRELLEHLRGERDLPDALRSARVRTRRFAVRQQRWFGKDPRIEWFPPPGGPDGDTATVAAAIDTLWRKRAADGQGSVATVDEGPESTDSAPISNSAGAGGPVGGGEEEW